METDRNNKAEDREDECTICLQPISRQAITQPCRHGRFCFACILTWLRDHPSCPLCKSDVTSLRHNIRGDKYDTFEINFRKDVARATPPQRPRLLGERPRLGRYNSSHHIPIAHTSPAQALDRRKQIYEHMLYSRHVGSNRISGYREVNHVDFRNSEHLVARAKKWIRRELQVFSFLNPSQNGSSNQGRTNNAEFLLSYIIAILQTVDIKGSDGRAEDLLTDYLGRDTSKLFLHELGAFIRSPYESLEMWDNHVQYGPIPPRAPRDSRSRRGVSISAAPSSPPVPFKRRRVDSYRPSRDNYGPRRRHESYRNP